MKKCNKGNSFIVIIIVSLLVATNCRDLRNNEGLTSEEQVNADTIIIENDELIDEDSTDSSDSSDSTESLFTPPRELLAFFSEDATPSSALLDFFTEGVDSSETEPSLSNIFTDGDSVRLNPLEALSDIFTEDEDPLSAIVNLLSGDDDDSQSKKNFGLFPQFNPGQILNPIQQKISEWAALLTHPNAGFGLPKPFDIWNKIQQTLGGPNKAIYGLGQNGGHDYPFPYRNTNQRSVREVGSDEKSASQEKDFRKEFETAIKQLNFLKAKLEAYRDLYWEKMVGSGKNKTDVKDAYRFPFLLSPVGVENALGNVTGLGN